MKYPRLCWARFDWRHLRWWWQRRTRGFDDRDLWSLNTTIAEFMAPRLRAFSSHPCSYPPSLSPDEWMATVTKMAEWFEQYAGPGVEDDSGLQLFAEWFFDLWN